MSSWQAIAAMADNRAIGYEGGIPWHLPEDFRWFKEKTLGHVVVMGRKTFESLGRPLPKRENIVISRQSLSLPGCQVLPDLDSLAGMDFGDRTCFIIGGAMIYEAAMSRCSDLWISHVRGEPKGDTFFPIFEPMFEAVETVREFPEFRVVHYRRK